MKMSVRVKYKKTGYIGFASEKVAEILESRGEVGIVSIDENQPELIQAERDAKAKREAKS
jgi:hypothetical protein